ncbi:UNVERIFIED_CONTAM: Carotenoid cleavage dioxygenase 8, chloroplastic [Sesamum radiatum]|uniref:Carotenoid cleavage dioxygenase 8, chloroplastic n=1 Tax=Sesamum radiatum TaxID=300843 RepID=A0AAW2JSX5_SESRA
MNLCKKLCGNNRDRLGITNIATNPPSHVAPDDQSEKEMENDRNHVAWTSVRQERWQGELHVQGKIPLWLTYGMVGVMAHWDYNFRHHGYAARRLHFHTWRQIESNATWRQKEQQTRARYQNPTTSLPTSAT